MLKANLHPGFLFFPQEQISVLELPPLLQVSDQRQAEPTLRICLHWMAANLRLATPNLVSRLRPIRKVKKVSS